MGIITSWDIIYAINIKPYCQKKEEFFLNAVESIQLELKEEAVLYHLEFKYDALKDYSSHSGS